jgi:branched-chain amino acid transport system substrate-binding protein
VWVKTVNDAGGLNVGGKKMKIEVIEYDDRSNSEEMIKAVERLATQDKVDFILPPWSTGMNLAAAPLFNKYGYPHLAVTANSNRAPEMVKRWPNLTFWLGLAVRADRRPGRNALGIAQGRQDRHQDRDGGGRRPVRHRAVDLRRARG